MGPPLVSGCFDERRYESAGVRESGRPAVFDPCRDGDRVEVISASHNAAGRGIRDDQHVRTTVLIVDDHDGFRESARALLRRRGSPWSGAPRTVPRRWRRCGGCGRKWCCWMCSCQCGRLRGRRATGGCPGPPRVVLISSRDAAAYGPRLGAARPAGSLRSGSYPVRRWPRWSAEQSRRGVWLLWPAAAVVGLTAEWRLYGWADPGDWAPDLVTGWTMIACGLAGGRGGRRAGPTRCWRRRALPGSRPTTQ